MNSILLKSIATLICVITMGACGASRQQAILDTVKSPIGQTRPATFEALQDDFRYAEQEKVNLISPQSYLDAKKYFQNALQLKESNQPQAKVEAKLKDARKSLDKAIVLAKENKDQVQPLISARETALNSGAAELKNKDLRSLEKHYIELVTNLEKPGERSEALAQIPDLTHAYQNLTLKTLESKYIGEAITNVNLAKKEGAEDIVPKTLASTEATIKKAKDYITQDQKTEEMIAQLGDNAAFASRRLLALTRDTKAWKDLSPEDRSLKVETLLSSIGTNITGKDLRDLSFEGQVATLNTAIVALNNDRASLTKSSSNLQKGLKDSETQMSTLQDKTKNYDQLAAKDEKNKTFDNVRSLFDENEAKVYRQGNSLVISLKKINFPVGAAEIPTPSFPLLQKVQKAIRTFKEPSIVVEGHTDSTGNADMNKTLSEKRATAVKDYLLSNDVVPQEKVVAIGYGSEKPLASNKSASGRSTNRRIDIVINE
ncbi:MAG: hypothetical protein JWQ35_2426 [Bacteriovoracaceae bacterium]|nr:hypothetical protein [Bacteriovoracaceae bacterium]